MKSGMNAMPLFLLDDLLRDLLMFHDLFRRKTHLKSLSNIWPVPIISFVKLGEGGMMQRRADDECRKQTAKEICIPR